MTMLPDLNLQTHMFGYAGFVCAVQNVHAVSHKSRPIPSEETGVN